MNNSHIPEPVLRALRHVRVFHPSVDRVTFWSDQKWAFMDEDHDVPTFDPGVDVSILEDAADSLDSYPYAFQLDNPEPSVVLSDLIRYMSPEDSVLDRAEQLRLIAQRIYDDIPALDDESPKQVESVSPSPWEADPEGAHCYTVTDANGVAICDVRRGVEHADANTEAIARVPEMIAALTYYRYRYTNSEPSVSVFGRMVDNILDAIPGCGAPQA